ncbi:MAG: hypothetical protein H6712_30940 [Myxococcales bacterium]|nr:hypothetical protein [Myxococcales bacterium]MCB9718308.1 hypothetical protein [Myxococcales bacterium]
MARRSWALGLLAASGCIYPSSDPTGVELSWRFVEHNEVDGEEAALPRTCQGAATEQIAADITDLDDPLRAGTFRFDCGTGYQSALDLQIQASDAFVRLDPGPYQLDLRAVDDANDAPVNELVEEREVEVESRRITTQTWIIRRAPVTWSLELLGLERCDALATTLRYASPETDLADYSGLADDPPPVYRQALRSDRGLGLAGEAITCDPELAGTHRFEGIDRGEYVLELDMDGVVCTVLVDLRPREGTSSVIDLANLPCGG